MRDQRGFGEVDGRHEQPVRPRARHVSRDRKHAADTSDLAIEAELADDDEIVQRVGIELTRCGEERQRNRQIERSPDFLSVGGGKMNDSKDACPSFAARSGCHQLEVTGSRNPRTTGG